jgi:heme-degrading monooxygenase HmoA
MFIALYEIIAKPGHEADLLAAWTQVTEAIYRIRGSLGSRIHTTETPRRYIAYAQWPSAHIYDSSSHITNFDPNEKLAFDRMKEFAESIKLIERMEVHTDRLRAIPNHRD